MIELELSEISRTIVEELGDVTSDESVLVLTDPERSTIARAITTASRAAGAPTVLSVMPRLDAHGREPPEQIAEAMKAADITFAVTSTSMTHTRARREAAEHGMRTFILRELDVDTILRGGINTDYDRLTELTTRLAERVTEADTAHVTSETGTDITMDISGRPGLVLDGKFDGEGVRLTNGVPSGEVPVAPVEGTSEGTIVVDHSMDNVGTFDDTIEIEFEQGFVSNVSGGESANRLRQILKQADENAGNLAEFAIGTNPDARLTGILAEDKKAIGTAHFAVGDSQSIEGEVESNLHIDGMVTCPTVELDGDLIVDEGNLVIAD